MFIPDFLWEFRTLNPTLREFRRYIPGIPEWGLGFRNSGLFSGLSASLFRLKVASSVHVHVWVIIAHCVSARRALLALEMRVFVCTCSRAGGLVLLRPHALSVSIELTMVVLHSLK